MAFSREFVSRDYLADQFLLVKVGVYPLATTRQLEAWPGKQSRRMALALN
jgi:hypothetical protein